MDDEKEEEKEHPDQPKEIFTCEVCNLKVASRSKLKSHFEAVHMKMKRYNKYLLQY